MRCSACDKPAELACKLCKYAPVITSDARIAHYCDADCQRSHRETHKVVCHKLRNRRLLYRVTELAQGLFYIFRGWSWGEIDLLSMKREGDKLLIEAQIDEDGAGNAVFPRTLFHPSKNEDERLAILTFLGCIRSCDWMLEFISALLNHIVASSHHITIHTQNDTLSIIDARAFRQTCRETGKHPSDCLYVGPSHMILKLALHSGDVFAVDLVGAQFGHNSSVMEWTAYSLQHIARIESFMEAAEPKKLLDVHNPTRAKVLVAKQKIGDLFVGADGKLLDKVEVELMDAGLLKMNVSMLKWQRNGELSIRDLWELPEDGFQKKLQNLIRFVAFDIEPGKYSTVVGSDLRKDFTG